jgi:hypothetical protein
VEARQKGANNDNAIGTPRRNNVNDGGNGCAEHSAGDSNNSSFGTPPRNCDHDEASGTKDRDATNDAAPRDAPPHDDNGNNTTAAC